MTASVGEEGWDRTFLDLSSKMAQPLCDLYGLFRYRLVMPIDPAKFNNRESTVAEVATRILIVVAAIGSIAALAVPIVFAATFLGVGSKLLRAIGFWLQKEGYTYVKGQAPEKPLTRSQVKLATWNVCGIGGGMNFDHGGVNDWTQRLDRMVDKIIAEDPDVLVLQEVYDTALAEALIEKLSAHYAHIFTHIGPNVIGSVGGGMVFSKCAIGRFTSTPFTNNSWTLNRTFTTLDIKAKPDDALPCARLIGSHLIHDNNAHRMEQVAQIVDSVARETLALPTLLMGDLNLERDNPEEGGQLNARFIHAYQGPEPTCTNELVRQWSADLNTKSNETIDYISLFKENGRLPVISQNIEMGDTHLIRAFDSDYNTKSAISDHHGIATIISF